MSKHWVYFTAKRCTICNRRNYGCSRGGSVVHCTSYEHRTEFPSPAVSECGSGQGWFHFDESSIVPLKNQEPEWDEDIRIDYSNHRSVRFCMKSGPASWDLYTGVKHTPKPCKSRFCKNCGLKWSSAVVDYYARVWKGLHIRRLYMSTDNIDTSTCQKRRENLITWMKRNGSQFLCLQFDSCICVFTEVIERRPKSAWDLKELTDQEAVDKLSDILWLPQKIKLSTSSHGDWDLPAIPRPQKDASEKDDEAEDEGQGHKREIKEPTQMYLGFKHTAGVAKGLVTVHLKINPDADRDFLENPEKLKPPPPGLEREFGVYVLEELGPKFEAPVVDDDDPEDQVEEPKDDWEIKLEASGKIAVESDRKLSPRWHAA